MWGLERQEWLAKETGGSRADGTSGSRGRKRCGRFCVAGVRVEDVHAGIVMNRLRSGA
jgi:hypothetical protein